MQVIPQDVWLSQSLPNLEDFLATIPTNILVSQEEELASQKYFEYIMCEVKNAKVHQNINQNPKQNCMKCNFNTSSSESLKIHIRNVHEPKVFQCDQCLVIVLGEHILKTHIKLAHQTKKQTIVIKKIPEPH